MNIKKYNSPNKYNGRQGWKPDIIVCHITEGNFDGAVSWLCNPTSEASAHYVVSRTGAVAQLVDLKDGSWCNGTNVSNAADKRHYSKSTHPLVKSRKANANLYTVSIEFEGFFAQGAGSLTEAQIEAGVELIKHIKAEVKLLFGNDIKFDRQSIIGHYEVTPITKPNCPGKNFPFTDIIQKLNGAPVPVKPPVTPTKPIVSPNADTTKLLVEQATLLETQSKELLESAKKLRDYAATLK